MGYTTSLSVVNSSIWRNFKDRRLIEKIYWKHTVEKVNIIDCLSPSIAQNIKNIFTVNKTIVKIAPCSFSPEYHPDNEQNQFMPYDSGEKTYDFCFVSRLIENKGCDLLVQILQKFENEQIKLKVLICGQGPLKQTLISATKKFRYIDTVFNNNLRGIDAIKKCKFLLSLQKYENYPSQVIFEAAITKTIVVLTNVGDSTLLVNNNRGVVIEHTDPDLRPLIRILKNHKLQLKLCDNLSRFVKTNHTLDNYHCYFVKYIDSFLNSI
ncbi:glycosyltransferase [Verrucomicrobia bacterium]|nr:glycosyltransferase [Verrucomicrobiota bacterium]